MMTAVQFQSKLEETHDFLSQEPLLWQKQLMPFCGDANTDGQFQGDNNP